MSGKEKRFFTVDFVMVSGHSRENVTRFVFLFFLTVSSIFFFFISLLLLVTFLLIVT